ncbi:MAG TPA: hypothetical protein VI818_08105 [Candidatus Thermoplasmatota archaeon]|nr:hypothetical protein [Candidatus Thermoplasmatota archaeon]
MSPLALMAFGASLVALLVAVLALRGTKAAALALLPLPMRRARLHFAVLAVAWLLALLSLGLALLFDVPPERLLIVALAGHTGLLVLALGYAASLYAPPPEATP